MVPEKLQVRNFMCYGEDVPPLPFGGLHVACLSGHNGAGKSALLDAMTWALWGKARAKIDDDLIKLDRDEMEVVFEFRLDGQLYRVIRRRERGKRSGKTTLDFQICDADGMWRRLTGDTVGETQAAISRALRIEYDTFINSAFLLQGRADEFTSRKPAERKQVLADILGLAEYEELEARAKDYVNQFSKDIDIVQSHIVRLQVEVALRDEREQRLHEAQEQVATFEEERDAHEATLQTLRDQVAELQRLHERREALQRTIHQQEQAQHELYARMAETQANVQHFETIIADRANIEAGQNELATTQTELETLNQRQEEYNRLRSEWRDWDDKLKEVRHAIELEQRGVQAQLDQLDTQLARRPAIAGEREPLTQQLAAIAGLQADRVRLRAEESRLVEQQTEALELQVQIKDLQGMINVQRDSLLAAQQEQQRKIEELALQTNELPKLEREQRAVRGELLRFQAHEDELITRRDELAVLAQRLGELQAEYKNVEAEGKAVAEKLRLIDHGTALCPVCHSELGADELEHLRQQYEDQRALLRIRLVEVRQASKTYEHDQAEQRAAIEQLEQTCAGRAQAEGRLAQLELRLSQAQAAQTALEEAQLTLRTLEQQLEQRDYAHEEQRALQQIEQQRAPLGDLRTIKATLAQVRSDLAAIERELQQTEQIQQRVARIDAELAAIDAAALQRPAIFARVEQLRTQLELERYGEAERQQRDAIKAQGQALGYSRELHDAVRARILELQAWEARARDLEGALHYIEREREQGRRDEEQRQRIDVALAEQRQQIAVLDQQLSEKAQVDRTLRAATMELQTTQHNLARVQSALGSAKADLERCEQAAKSLAQEQERAAALADDRAVYEELAQAFGKKGIQAMLIDTAIPELEQETNELLARMTDNQLHVAFDTQREKRSGDGAIETLDIRIADSLGTRDYQMYSGGEAFRVNFAIRIALSKLLARRAGASLKTLVIDEGFGTQDGAGRDRIVEAINTIEPDFERILVITHIQELKDMFQTQIEISKAVDGSTWSIT